MAEQLVSLAAIRAAAARIASIAVKTPLIRASFPGLSGHGSGKEIYLKAESLQPIGAFKIRGAANKILQLTPAEIARGVITYSSGNHAQAVAYVAREVGAKSGAPSDRSSSMGWKAVIVMPSNAPEVKKRATAALGAEIVEVGPASSDRKTKAEELESKYGYVMIPPYDDEQIIAGQGTCGLEILEDLPDVDLVLSPVSGGGLLSGIATAIKLSNDAVRVIGIEPELAADAQESFRSHQLVAWPADMTTRTMCDGLRTQSLGALNFEHIRAYVDDIITVSEAEIRSAMRTLLYSARLTPEPSGACSAAGILFHRDQLLPFRKVVVVMSGGNVEPGILKSVLAEEGPQ